MTTTLPPLASTPVAKASDLSEPTKSQAAYMPPLAFSSALRAPAVGRIEGCRGAGRERGLALAGVDVGDDRRLPNSARASASPIRPTPPRPTSSSGPRAARSASRLSAE